MNKDLIEQYKLLHAEQKEYGSSNDPNVSIGQIFDIVYDYGCFHVLDFGCGKGVLVDYLNSFGLLCVGYDPAITKFSKMEKDASYDAVVCLDVLEHLDDNTIDEELELIRKTYPFVIVFNVATRPASTLLPNGTNCHTMVKSADWWQEKLSKFFSRYEIVESKVIGGQASSIFMVFRII